MQTAIFTLLFQNANFPKLVQNPIVIRKDSLILSALLDIK